MPETRSVPVRDLMLDLKNFRTVEQRDEIAAIQAMIAISPDYLWGLAESLLDDGYLPTDSIIVLRLANQSLVVREGNRRVAVLKLIHGVHPLNEFTVPAAFATRVAALTPAWKTDNASVPCTIYEVAQSAIVDRIVTLAHGKGEKASRDPWAAVARARHNRSENGAVESGLQLLESYLAKGSNCNDSQRARWAGKYNLTTLDEAIKKVAPRIGLASASQVAKDYPTVPQRDALESVLFDIGMEQLTFPILRGADDILSTKYGFPALEPARGNGAGSAVAGGGTTSTAGTATAGKGPAKAKRGAAKAKSTPRPTTDPRSIVTALQDWRLKHSGRAKLETLRLEAINLKVEKTPHAFVFLLRALFELSAKAYCDDHKTESLLALVDKKGKERSLAELLSAIVAHLTANGANKARQKELTGAQQELTHPNGLLSVTSMNQLVHNRKFVASPEEVSTKFHNVFPLLELMN